MLRLTRLRLKGGYSAVVIHVELEEFPLVCDTQVQIVVLCELLHLGHEGGVLVARHGREQMVLQLILHTTPQPLGERVIRDGVSCRPELAVNELGILIEKDLLALYKKWENDILVMSHVIRKKI